MPPIALLAPQSVLRNLQKMQLNLQNVPLVPQNSQVMRRGAPMCRSVQGKNFMSLSYWK